MNMVKVKMVKVKMMMVNMVMVSQGPGEQHGEHGDNEHGGETDDWPRNDEYDGQLKFEMKIGLFIICTLSTLGESRLQRATSMNILGIAHNPPSSH